jgi:hypothetical protein
VSYTPASQENTAFTTKCTLAQEAGVWVLFWEGKEYIRLLDAKSRDDAEQQLAEMYFMLCGTRKEAPFKDALPLPVAEPLTPKNSDTHTVKTGRCHSRE